MVSIHAPREGCDAKLTAWQAWRLVSIHAPREGCDFFGVVLWWYFTSFQFTHPGRGATTQEETREEGLPSFNSRTPGGVRLVPDSDYSGVGMFQFTHPGRGATSGSPRL